MERFWRGAANARRLSVLSKCKKNQVYVSRVRRERGIKGILPFLCALFVFFRAKSEVKNRSLPKGARSGTREARKLEERI